jgi:hypothetical protein
MVLGDGMSNDHMMSATRPIKRPLIEEATAANADQLEEPGTRTETPATERTGGWDAYDVWRRFIKEARERRKGASSTQNQER